MSEVLPTKIEVAQSMKPGRLSYVIAAEALSQSCGPPTTSVADTLIHAFDAISRAEEDGSLIPPLPEELQELVSRTRNSISDQANHTAVVTNEALTVSRMLLWAVVDHGGFRYDVPRAGGSEA